MRNVVIETYGAKHIVASALLLFLNVDVRMAQRSTGKTYLNIFPVRRTRGERGEGRRYRNAPSYAQFASQAPDELYAQLGTSGSGLTEAAAAEGLRKHGLNEPAKKERESVLVRFAKKFANPLVIIPASSSSSSPCFSARRSARSSSLCMILISVGLDFFQEQKSENAVEKLNALVRTQVTVIREGKKREIDISEIVPGDIVELCAGSMIPADLRLITAKDLFVNQSSLTGESFPVEKTSAKTHCEHRIAR